MPVYTFGCVQPAQLMFACENRKLLGFLSFQETTRIRNLSDKIEKTDGSSLRLEAW